MIKAPSLCPNNTIAILAPADRPRSTNEVERATALVKQLGFTPRVFGDTTGRYGAWMASDDERATMLINAWNDNDVRAIWLLRGGWGAARLLPLLDYATIAANPKIVIANDEASGLLIAIYQQTGLVTLHGPELGRCKLNPLTRTWLLQLLTNPQEPGAVPHHEADTFDKSTDPVVLASGYAEGRLIGGDVTEIASLLGTPYALDVTNRLLFLALTPAVPYVLERHLTAIRLGGLAQQAAGILLSDYVEIQERRGRTLTYEEALRYGLKGVQQPTLAGLPLGRAETTMALPLGVHAVLDANAKSLVLSEGMVE